MAAPYHGLVAYICLSTSDQSFATVIVGPEERRFVVHEAILNHYSKFFRKAFTAEFEEAKSKTITLAEDSILTFEFFVHWLYFQRLPNPDMHDDPELVKQFMNSKSGANTPSRSQVVRLFVFGDKYDVPELRKAAIDHMFKTIVQPDGQLPPFHVIDHVFAHLPEESSMCRLFVASYFQYEELEINRAQCTNTAFMRAMWERYARFHCTYERKKASIKLCDYHKHTTAEERKVCEEHRAACKKAWGVFKAASTQPQE